MSKDVLRVWAKNADRDKAWPVMNWLSLTCDMGEFGDGRLVLEVPADAYWLTETGLDIANPEYGAEVSFDLHWRDFTTPLFMGPVEMVALNESRAGRSVVFTCSTFWQHFLTRRIFVSTDGSKSDVTSNKADRVLFELLHLSGFGGTGVGAISPTGYPSATSRQNFGSWTVNTTTVTPPGSHGTTVNLDVSDGRRVLEEALDMLEAYGMALTIAESPAGTFTYTIAVSYQSNDYTDEVVLDLRRGTASQYIETIDYTKLENVVQIKGAGQGASQNKSWAKDSTSYTDYGNFEGSYTYDEADANAISGFKSEITTRNASPVISFDTSAVDQPAATFQTDYAIRDLVTIRGGVWGRSATKLVTGCKISASGRDASASVLLGDPPRNNTQETMRGAGLPMGRARGQASKFKPVSGN